MKRKWRAEWTKSGMQHKVDFSSAGGVQGAQFWLKAYLTVLRFDIPEVYHLQELSEPPEPVKFHSVLDWPHGREGILWIAPVP